MLWKVKRQVIGAISGHSQGRFVSYLHPSRDISIFPCTIKRSGTEKCSRVALVRYHGAGHRGRGAVDPVGPHSPNYSILKSYEPPFSKPPRPYRRESDLSPTMARHTSPPRGLFCGPRAPSASRAIRGPRPPAATHANRLSLDFSYYRGPRCSLPLWAHDRGGLPCRQTLRRLVDPVAPFFSRYYLIS